MTWQDAVLSFGGLAFAAACIPTIRQAEKPAVGTSAFTASLLLVQAATLASLGLWWACFGNLATATAWTVLLVQRIRRDRTR